VAEKCQCVHLSPVAEKCQCVHLSPVAEKCDLLHFSSVGLGLLIAVSIFSSSGSPPCSGTC